MLGVLISAALLVIFFRSVDLAEMVETFAQVNPAVALPAVGVYFFGVWLRAARWRLLMSPFANVSTSRLFRVILIGFAVNNLLPLRLGEVVRMFLLRHANGVPIAATLASILLERVLDVVALSVLLTMVALSVPLSGWLAGLASLASLVTAAALVGLLVLLVAPRPWLRWGFNVAVAVAGRMSQRLARLIDSFLSGFRAVETPRSMLQVSILSLLCWTAELGLYYILMLGFGFDAGILGLVAGMVSANLATALPSSPGYVGTFDVPLQSALSDGFGVPSAVAGSYTLVAHALLLIPVVVVGLILLSREDLSMRALGRGRIELRSGQQRGATW